MMTTVRKCPPCVGSRGRLRPRRSGDASTISGYLGKSDRFDWALGAFAVAYANQNEQDHVTLVRAVRSERVNVLVRES